jgi:hypothetical protein
VEWPKPTSPYLKLHIVTERIGRNGEIFGKLKPPVEIADTKTMISGVTDAKGPASQVSTLAKTRAHDRGSSANARVASLHKLVSDGGAKKSAGNEKSRQPRHTASIGQATARPEKTATPAAKTNQLVISGEQQRTRNMNAGTAPVAASAGPGAKVIKPLLVHEQTKASLSKVTATAKKPSSGTMAIPARSPAARSGTAARPAAAGSIPNKAQPGQSSAKSALSLVISGKSDATPAGGTITPKQ